MDQAGDFVIERKTGYMKHSVQTGLRIPEELYNQLREYAEKTGLSINAQILCLIRIGMDAVNLGIQAERHVLSHTPPNTDG